MFFAWCFNHTVSKYSHFSRRNQKPSLGKRLSTVSWLWNDIQGKASRCPIGRLDEYKAADTDKAVLMNAHTRTLNGHT